METVRLTWPIPDDVRPGSTIVPFGDWGSGTVDYTAPIGQAILARTRSITETSHAETGHAEAPHAGGYARGGHAQGMHAVCPHAGWQDTASMIVQLLYGPGGSTHGNGSSNGVHKFGARLYDPDGRVSVTLPSSSEEMSVVINTSPRAPSSMTATSLAAGVLTLDFTASVDLR